MPPLVEIEELNTHFLSPDGVVERSVEALGAVESEIVAALVA